MKIFLGADHGGFQLKEFMKKMLIEHGYEIEDMGSSSLVPGDDYPIVAFEVAKKVASGQGIGILFCRSGGGMAIAANRIKGVRAVDCKDQECIRHARNDNNANILTLPANWINEIQAKELILTFLNTAASTESRHIRRVSLLDSYLE